MKNIKIFSLLFLFLFTSLSKAQPDIQFKIPQTSLNEALNTLIEARSLNFGDYSGTWITDGYFINIDAAQIHISNNNTAYIEGSIVITAENPLNFIDNITVHANTRIDGTLSYENISTGFKIIFTPLDASIFNTNGSWGPINTLMQNVGNTGLKLFVLQLGSIELNIGSQIFPSLLTNTFSSEYPALFTVSESYIALNFNIAGARKITAQNSVNNLSSVGTLDFLNGSTWQTFTSPHSEWWELNSNHSFRTSSSAITFSNQQYKFKNWADIDNGTSNQLTINVQKDKKYVANYLAAQTLSLQSKLEGVLSSGVNMSFGSQNVLSPFSDLGFIAPLFNTIGTTSQILKNQNQYFFIKWEDEVKSLSREISLTQPSTFISCYKGLQLSNNISSFSKNNQKKVISAFSDPKLLYKVYESLGTVWMETSSDKGNTWVIYSNTPLYEGSAIDPSIEHLYNPSLYSSLYGDILYVPFISEDKIRMKIITSKSSADIIVYSPGDNTTERTPVATIFNGNKIMVVWKSDGLIGEVPVNGLFYQIGTLGSTPYEIIWNNSKTYISGTNINSKNPCIESLENDNIVRFAWEENNKIKYANIVVNSNYSITLNNTKIISDYSGFTSNTNPALIAVNGGARLSWVGTRSNNQDALQKSAETTSISMESKSVFMDPANTSRVWAFGNNVRNTSINSSSDCYTISWGRGNFDKIQFTDSYTLSRIDSLNITGSDVQISNGNTKFDMRATAFNSQSLPYCFNTSSVYQNNLSKVTNYSVNSGREGIIKKDVSRFYFSFGDIKADGKDISFKFIDDTTRIVSTDDLNSYLETEPIYITNNSEIFYSVQYGPVDSISRSTLLKNSFINFKLKIIDAVSGKVLYISDNITYDSLNATAYKNLSYLLHTDGINCKYIKLCLTVSSDSDLECSLKELYASDFALNKSNIQSKYIKNLEELNTYNLDQNFPNPFNPSTEIKFQIPQPGIITLKVYDILGNEVRTILNEYKEKGEYSLTFEASNLASGVYLYQLKAGSYIQTRKMIFIK